MIVPIIPQVICLVGDNYLITTIVIIQGYLTIHPCHYHPKVEMHVELIPSMLHLGGMLLGCTAHT